MESDLASRRNTTQKLSLIDACHLRAAGTLSLIRSQKQSRNCSCCCGGQDLFLQLAKWPSSFPEGDICIFRFQSCQQDGLNRPQSQHKKIRGASQRGNKVVVNKIQVTIFSPHNPLHPRWARVRQLTASQLVHPNGTAREMQ